jgi:hypothetical protein
MTKLREQAIETLENIKENKVKFSELRGLV